MCTEMENLDEEGEIEEFQRKKFIDFVKETAILLSNRGGLIRFLKMLEHYDPVQSQFVFDSDHASLHSGVI